MLMPQEKESDGKLYRVYHKKGNHQNTKMNQDGTKAAIQFTDEENDLDGPLEIVEADESEYVKTEYVEVEPGPRTWQEIIVEDVIAPVAREFLEQAFEVGFQYLGAQMEKKVVPKIRQKTKQFTENTKNVFAGIKDGLAGKETKVSQLIRESEKKKQTSVAVKERTFVADKEAHSNKSSEPKQELSQEEIQQIIEAMKNSAMMLATCIRMLNNSVLADDGSNLEKRLELQLNIQELTTADVMGRIDMLLEDKNRDLLDATSVRMIAAFRKGNFVVNGEEVPIQNYLESNE